MGSAEHSRRAIDHREDAAREWLQYIADESHHHHVSNLGSSQTTPSSVSCIQQIGCAGGGQTDGFCPMFDNIAYITKAAEMPKEKQNSIGVDNRITIGITTCKRLHLFERTVKALKRGFGGSVDFSIVGEVSLANKTLFVRLF